MMTRTLRGGLMAAAMAAPLHAALAQAPAAPAGQPQAEAQAPMPLQFDAKERETPATVLKGVCPLSVLPADDQRQNKLTIGASLRGPLLTGDSSPWVTDSLLALQDYGYTVQRASSANPPADGVLIKSTLSRAYTWQVGVKIFSMVALKAQFIDKNGVLQEKHYRAHGDKTNMWGASSEYLTTLNYGLNTLVRAMADDLVELCKGKKVEPYTYALPEGKPAAK